MPASSKIALLGVTILFFSSAQAWRVDIWEGQQCTSGELSSQEIKDDVSNAQCYSIPVDAESATVTREDGDSGNNNIEFYTGSGCDSSNYVASSDGGCVDFEQTGATTYMLQTDQSDPGRKLRIKGRRWTGLQEDARQKLGITSEQSVGSLSPDWDPTLPAQLGHGHGNITERFGTVWKWQQVALGMTVGVPVDEWDDKIHVKDDRFIVYGHDDYDVLQERDVINSVEQSLYERDAMLQKRWNYGQCKAVLQCGRQLAGAATANIGSYWQTAVKAAYKLKKANESFTAFSARHPWFVTLGSNAIGYGLGYAKGSTGSKDTTAIANCSGDSTQIQTWVQSIATVANASKDNAAQVLITLPNGDTVKISAEVVPKASYDKNNIQCDADGKN